MLYFLLLNTQACKKEKIENNDKNSNDIFSGKYSIIYDKWKLIGVSGGFSNNEVMPDFDYLEFKQTGIYEKVKNKTIIEKGTVSKDSLHSTEDLLYAAFVPDGSLINSYPKPHYRSFELNKDSLIISFPYISEYSFHFVRLNKAIPKSTEGFHINTGKIVVLQRNEIDYYVFSSQRIYLKNMHTLIRDFKYGAKLDVFVDDTYIYSLTLDPADYGYMHNIPFIRNISSFYSEKFITIDLYNSPFDVSEKLDPRNDIRIAQSLKKTNQFSEGLNCSIQSIQITAEYKVRLELLLNNNDICNYYYLDPDKMEMNAYHAYTSGLLIADFQKHEFYTHEIISTNDPWAWEKGLSLIKSGEKKSISIIYDNFDKITSGQYKATFRFPVPPAMGINQVQMEEGKIWEGELYLTKNISIE